MTGPACRVWGDTSMYCVLAVLFSPIPALLGVIVKASWTFASSSNSYARARLMRDPLLGRCVWSLCCSLHLPPPETDWVLELVRGLRRSAPPPLADTQTSAAVCLVNGHTSNYWDGHARTATHLHFPIFDDYDVTFDRVLAEFEAKTFAYTHPGVWGLAGPWYI